MNDRQSGKKKLVVSGYGALIASILDFLLLGEAFLPIMTFFLVFFSIFIGLHTNRKKQSKKLWYWNLSYRGKFIRTAWLLPFALLLIIAFWLLESIDVWRKLLATFMLLAIYVTQTSHTYMKWKNNNDANL